MLSLAFIIGFYSYVLFFLGISGIFYGPLVLFVSFVFFSVLITSFRKQIFSFFTSIHFPKTVIGKLFLTLFSLQALVNLIGALGPELSFDALWYHLTLAKLYIINHTIAFFPGGLLYYSPMPKLIEPIYAASLMTHFTPLPKIIHFFFGIFSCAVLYKIARKFVSRELALFSVVVFYSNLVVGWESISGYIDLARVFFEAIALLSLFNWIQTKKTRHFILSAIFTGFAITTKLLAFNTLFIFLLIAFVVLIKWKRHFKKIAGFELSFFLISLLIPLPWFIFSFVNTSNPFYPFFSPHFAHLQQTTFSFGLLNPAHVIATFWKFFTHADDPINPLYLGLFPLLFFVYKKFTFQEKILLFFSFAGIVLWYFISKVEGTRLALPYIFSLSILAGVMLKHLSEYKLIFRSLILATIFIAFLSIGFRTFANAKFIPVILGEESEAHFLTDHLNFNFGDFFDTDGYFASHIKPTDKVLLLGFHNLYYVDFPFIDYSWYKKSDKINYIAVQNGGLSNEFKNFKQVYKNNKTHVTLYAKN